MSLDLLLARQAGVISRGQALGCGLSGGAVDHRVRTRRWRPLHPCVYLARGREPDDEARARAALLWAGANALLTGAAAAWWHGLLADAPETLSVAVPVRRPDRPGVAVRCRMPAAADRTRLRGLSVTALGLTVLEAALEVGGAEGALLLDRAVEGGLGWAELLAAHRRNPASAAGPLLVASDARSATAAGELLAGLLRRSGIRGWHRGPTGRVVFPAARVVVEAGGWAPAAASATRPAARATLRFGRSELSSRPHAVLAEIAAAVAGRDIRHPRVGIGPPTGRCR
ncbi:MAG TPA: hypothetical protein VD903_01340 [Pseudonocardia sp.]|nr:hypothetical protein [Pseudonocardia sp.]